MTKGVVEADKALTNNNEFNGELEGAVISRWKKSNSTSRHTLMHVSEISSPPWNSPFARMHKLLPGPKYDALDSYFQSAECVSRYPR